GGKEASGQTIGQGGRVTGGGRSGDRQALEGRRAGQARRQGGKGCPSGEARVEGSRPRPRRQAGQGRQTQCAGPQGCGSEARGRQDRSETGQRQVAEVVGHFERHREGLQIRGVERQVVFGRAQGGRDRGRRRVRCGFRGGVGRGK